MSSAVGTDTAADEEAVDSFAQPDLDDATVAALVPPGEVEVLAPSASSDPALTRRERQVLGLLVKGMRNKEMAAALGIKDDTVRVHVKSIFSKFRVHTRTAAVVTALRRGLAQV